MKKIFIILAALFVSSIAFANLTENQEKELLVKIGKSIRRSYYVRGYSEVASNTSLWERAHFEAYLKDRSNESGPLDRNQIKEIRSCFSDKNCKVYLVEVSAEYMSGTGMTNHWILLDAISGSHAEVVNEVYSE